MKGSLHLFLSVVLMVTQVNLPLVRRCCVDAGHQPNLQFSWDRIFIVNLHVTVLLKVY